MTDEHLTDTKFRITASQLAVPLVVLLGGATGVGKSTIATRLAHRLGLTRVIPTDAIREVMRSAVGAEMLPTLHTSSFDAARVIGHPLADDADPVVVGFLEQASAVAVGVEALVRRAVEEGTDLIVEGAHLVPGLVDPKRFAGDALVVPIVAAVDDENAHRHHFLLRAQELRHRPAERYLDFFDNIRTLQDHIRSQAQQHDVPIVQSDDLDTMVWQVIDLVVRRVVGAIPQHNTA